MNYIKKISENEYAIICSSGQEIKHFETYEKALEYANKNNITLTRIR